MRERERRWCYSGEGRGVVNDAMLLFTVLIFEEKMLEWRARVHLRQKGANGCGRERGEKFRGGGVIVDVYGNSNWLESILDPRMLLWW
jgi:hypothetical protein